MYDSETNFPSQNCLKTPIVRGQLLHLIEKCCFACKNITEFKRGLVERMGKKTNNDFNSTFNHVPDYKLVSTMEL